MTLFTNHFAIEFTSQLRVFAGWQSTGCFYEFGFLYYFFKMLSLILLFLSKTLKSCCDLSLFYYSSHKIYSYYSDSDLTSSNWNTSLLKDFTSAFDFSNRFSNVFFYEIKDWIILLDSIYFAFNRLFSSSLSFISFYCLSNLSHNCCIFYLYS